MDNRKDNRSGKKRIIIRVIIAVGILLAALAVITAAAALVSHLMSSSGKNDYEIYLNVPDYERDITQDEEYMVLDRRVWVDDGVISAPLDDYDYKDDRLLVFFSDYFDALVRGDGKTLRTFYSDECLKDVKIPQKMPMQRVYDIMLRFAGREEFTDSDGVNGTRFIYRFEYKIKYNDGTFRTDLASDTVRPQLVTIEMKPDSILITDVVSNIRRK